MVLCHVFKSQQNTFSFCCKSGYQNFLICRRINKEGPITKRSFLFYHNAQYITEQITSYFQFRRFFNYYMVNKSIINPKQLTKLKGHKSYINCLVVHPINENLIVSGSDDKKINFWSNYYSSTQLVDHSGQKKWFYSHTI
ncbi:unnamed protein product [Paramecium sonneborni]|uniref:Uncharacterized protein n=1 Tax=Paramecium sonneborni TaxID=65129 RepID=A0A8S1RT95_9CILI|nr:unnamed protein product [Paramecium sonneborni]